MGQKYSVSAETACERGTFGKRAPGQPVPVVADHLPAADHQRRHHEHDRDPQPDLGQLERRPDAVPDRTRRPGSAADIRYGTRCNSGHRACPIAENRTSLLEAGTGLLSMLIIRL